MITKAAVLRHLGAPLAVEEVELGPIGPGEVRVEIAASGVCHSDWNAAVGDSAIPLPAVLGHEGSGTVQEVGTGVTTVSPGDAVALSWLPHCGRCAACQRGRLTLCEVATAAMGRGSLPRGGFRLSSGGERLHHYSYLSTFASQAAVDESCCIALPAGTDLDVAALAGCAVTTGFGAVMNRARVRPGSTVAVFGAGGVGLSVVMTCRLAGARGIVVVDPFPSRRALAVELGATDTRDPSDPAPDGCDYAFEAAGHPASAAKALSALRPGGTLVAVGLPPDGSTVSLPWPELVRGEKVVAGTFYGSARPRIDIPLILGLYAEGRLPLDRLIGRRYPLEGVNEAFADMGAGLAGRALLTP